jgi:hypothetical protein
MLGSEEPEPDWLGGKEEEAEDGSLDSPFALPGMGLGGWPWSPCCFVD